MKQQCCCYTKARTRCANSAKPGTKFCGIPAHISCRDDACLTAAGPVLPPVPTPAAAAAAAASIEERALNTCRGLSGGLTDREFDQLTDLYSISGTYSEKKGTIM